MTLRNKVWRPAILIFSALLFLMMNCALSFAQNESQAAVQDENYVLSHDVQEQTYTVFGTNPYSKTPGVITITLDGGVFRGKRISEGRFAGGLSISGQHHGTFTFAPYDASQPTYTGKFKFNLGSETPLADNATFTFAFLVECTGSDGSTQSFLQMETATVTGWSADIAFGKLRRVVEDTPDDTP